MRSTPRDSPEATARIAALVLIADGHVCRSEFDAFEQMDGPRELGLQFDSALASLMAEVDEPALQRKVLRPAVAAARADRHLAEGEALVLAAARRHWGLAEATETGSTSAGLPQAA